jgi:hypothetical protein
VFFVKADSKGVASAFGVKAVDKGLTGAFFVALILNGGQAGRAICKVIKMRGIKIDR